jgi:hypothetical protein
MLSLKSYQVSVKKGVGSACKKPIRILAQGMAMRFDRFLTIAPHSHRPPIGPSS